MTEMWGLGVPYRLILIFFLLGMPPAVVYPVILGFVRWNKSKIGRSMMFKGVALFLIFAQGLLSLYLSAEWWYPWFVAVVTGWLSFAVWYQTTTVVHTIREGEVEARMANRGGRTHGRTNAPEKWDDQKWVT